MSVWMLFSFAIVFISEVSSVGGFGISQEYDEERQTSDVIPDSTFDVIKSHHNVDVTREDLELIVRWMLLQKVIPPRKILPNHDVTRSSNAERFAKRSNKRMPQKLLERLVELEEGEGGSDQARVKAPRFG